MFSPAPQLWRFPSSHSVSRRNFCLLSARVLNVAEIALKIAVVIRGPLCSIYASNAVAHRARFRRLTGVMLEISRRVS